MPEFTGKKYDMFSGINQAISPRDNEMYLQESRNVDTNVVKGKIKVRKGSKIIVDDATTNINKFVEYRDDENDKDVLLVLDKDSTVTDRRLWHYTRTAKSTDQYVRADGVGPPDYSDGLSYGDIELGDSSFGVSFFPYRNMVRIGTGNGANNKPLIFGYWDRTGENGILRDSSKNRLTFSGYYLIKQQWVQQCNLFNGIKKVLVDTTRDYIYVLTNKGVEVRDSDGYIYKILDDVVAWSDGELRGGLSLDDTNGYLYATGKVPASTDTMIVRYNIDLDFEMDQSDTYTGTDHIYSVYTDESLVYATTDDINDAFITEYDTDLSASNNRYTIAGGSGISGLGITGDATYVYAGGDTHIYKMLKASPYTTTDLSMGVYRIDDIIYYNNKLHFLRIYPTTKETGWFRCDLDGTNIEAVGASHIQGNCYGFTNNGTSFYVANSTYSYYQKLTYIAATPTYTIDHYRPNKISLRVNTIRDSGNTETYFYAISIIDIWGQEHHLMESSAGDKGKIIIYINVDAENYNDLSGTNPSTDINELNSIWNEFRRIDKIRIYRGYAGTADAKEPTSNFQILDEIDFDSMNWVEETANSLYSFTYQDTGEVSTATYEESSGLPEYFKPYYTCWKYAHECNGYFYYGNINTDKVYKQKFIQSQLNAPDIIYELDTNFENLGISDGDEIAGFMNAGELFYVFKTQSAALYGELNRRRDYNIGLYAPDSIVENFFIAKDGFYAMMPDGPRKISKGVDSLFLSNSSLENTSGALFRENNKIWWLIPDTNGICPIYNYDDNTWDQYYISYTSGTSMTNVYIKTGLDGRVLTSATNLNKILEWNTGYKDGALYAGTGGNSMTIYIKSPEFLWGEDVLNAIVKRLWLTHKSTDALTVYLYYLNDNGSKNTNKSFAASSNLVTSSKNLQFIWGQSGYFLINQTVTDDTEIDMFGIETKIKRKDRI